MAAEAGLHLGLHLLHPANDAPDVAGNAQFAGFPGAGGHQNVGVAHSLELRDRGGGRAALDFHAVLLHESDVLVQGLVTDAEGGDHVPGHAAEARLPLEDGGLDARPAQEVGRRDAGGTAAHDGGALACDLCGTPDGGHQGLVAVLRRLELGVPDVDGVLIEVPGALPLTAVGADGAGEEGQGVLLGDELQGRAVETLAAELQILGDVLVDGAAALAGGLEAVQQGDGLVALAGGQGLDGLAVVGVGAGGHGEFRDRGAVGAGEGAVLHALGLLHHLAQAVVSAGLQDGGGGGDGPDARGEELAAVEGVGAAGEGDPHPAAEGPGDAIAHLDGQGEEAPAGHIHLLAGELATGGVHREGVGELQAELQPLFIRQGLEPLEHGHGVVPLEILVEVVLVEDDVVIAHAVQHAAGGAVAQDGRVALNKGVQVLLRQEVAGDALDLVRRAAVEGGDSDGPGDPGGDGRDVVALRREELRQHGEAFLELGGGAGIHHIVDVAVDLLALDAFQVVAHAHVENEAVRITQAIDLAEDLQRAPGLDVLILGLGHRELGGPLLVVALVRRQDAGAGHAGGQLRAVHFLDGLHLEEAGAGIVGGDDVLGQLAVGAGGGAEGGLDALPEDGQGLAGGPVALVDAKEIAGGGVLRDGPVHQGRKGDGIHFLRHGVSSLCQRSTAWRSKNSL